MLDDKQMERPEEMGETTPKGGRFRKEDHEQTHLQKEDLEHHPEHVKQKAKVSIPVPIATPVRSGMARKSTVGLDEAERTPPTTSPESSEKTQSSRKLKPQSSYEDADLRMPKKRQNRFPKRSQLQGMMEGHCCESRNACLPSQSRARYFVKKEIPSQRKNTDHSRWRHCTSLCCW